MYSEYERQKDKRTYTDRHVIYEGPLYRYPADRINPTREVLFQEGGMPQYAEAGAHAEQPADQPADEEIVAE